MGMPTEEDNLRGYNNTDLTYQVERFKGKRFFIAHGSGDDNVHYQNTLMLIKAFQRANVPFTLQVSRIFYLIFDFIATKL